MVVNFTLLQMSSQPRSKDFVSCLIPRRRGSHPTNMSGKVPASPKVAPYFVLKRSISQSSDDVGGVLSEAEPEGIPGYLVSTPSETNLFVGIGSDNEVVDMLPSGAIADEFGPRTVMVSFVGACRCGFIAGHLSISISALKNCRTHVANRAHPDPGTPRVCM